LSQYQGEKDVLIEEVKDNREAYQKAWILVAPMKSGGGSRTKFFEAMASGLPIVTTSQGIEGIIAENNKEAIVRDNLDKLAQEAIKLLQRKKLRETIGKKAQELVKREYTWQSSAEQLDKLYEEATHARKKS
jgi:glycosyltransferase involved in cell wall biosynthesis